jgi:DNA-binding MarR family transcriptional regulator
MRQLDLAKLSFAEWVALTILTAAATLSRPDLVTRIAAARVVPPGAEPELIAEMIGKNLVQSEERIIITEQGRAVYAPLRRSVQDITGRLLSDIPDEDIAAARRVLETVTQRAGNLLMQGSRGSEAGGR